jgi:ribonuclease P protein component
LSREGGISRRPRTRALGKDARVRKRREFLQIQNAGRRVATRHFLVVYLARSGPTRLGITVTKKIGNAVVRNRIKRAVRESFRGCRATMAGGVSVVVIARDGSSALDTTATAAELVPAFTSLGARPSAEARPTSGSR